MKQFRKVLKYLSLGVLTLVAIGLLVNYALNVWANGRLERKIAALRAAEQPVALGDLGRKPISPETNAATYLRRAQADVNAIETEFSAAFDAAPKAEQDLYDSAQLSPRLKNTIQAAFEAYPKVIGIIDQAAKCPEYDSGLDLTTDTTVFLESVVAQINASRAIIRVLNYQALRQIADGQQEDALRTCLTMFRLCRHFDRDPTITSYLAAIACRSVTVARANLALRTGPIADTLHAELEIELAKHESDEMFQNALGTERAFGLQSIYEMDRAVRFGPIGSPAFKNEACAYIDLLDIAIAQAGLPYADATQARVMYGLVSKAPVTQLIVPPLQATQSATARVRAELRSLRILNALARNREMADSTEPKLSDLSLPAEATVDPYDGGQLHLKKLPDGWLIYSVGANLADDGGDLNGSPTSLDVGLGPPSATAQPAEAAEPVPGSK